MCTLLQPRHHVLSIINKNTTWIAERVYHLYRYFVIVERNMYTASKILLFLYIVKFSRAEECDVRMWYLEMTTKGAFDGELSAEQQFIQKAINELVLNSKKDTSKRKVSCEVLEMYEEMLKPDEEDVDNKEENDPKSDKEGDSKDESLLTDKVKEDETKEALNDSEKTLEKIVEESKEVDDSQNVNEAVKTESDETELDETEVLSDDSNDGDEEGEEDDEIQNIKDELPSDDSSDDLDKSKDEETIVSSAEEETIKIDDDRPIGTQEDTATEKEKEVPEDSEMIDSEDLNDDDIKETSGVSEDDEETNDNENLKKEENETEKYDVENPKEKETKEEDAEEGYNNKEDSPSSDTGNKDSTNTTHSISPKVKTSYFGMNRIHDSYWFDVFDRLQNTDRFMGNTTRVNETDTQNDILNLTSSLTYNRLLCSACSLLMRHSTINTSCSGDLNRNFYTIFQSNETQLNQTDVKSSNDTTVKSPTGTDTLKAKETSNQEKSLASEQIAGKDITTDSENERNTKRDTSQQVSEDDNSKNDKGHQAPDVETRNDQVSPPDANSETKKESKNDDESSNKDRNVDEEVSQGENTPASERSEEKHNINQPDKPETTIDGTQVKSAGTQPLTETDKKATLILEQLQSHFDEFQEQVSSKTDSYSNKLQNLEMMVIRLENQLLKEKLSKNNHSSTITKLENHILRLENELLKLNQSYSDIRQKSDNMVKDQKKYLELSHSSQQTPAYGYSSVSGRDRSVSIDFQAKITYLTQLLSNQSMTIRQLKTRSEYLEDQNRLLYNMIMNQTALMTQIMTRVQDLTEQNIQQRIEAQKIRQEMDKMTSRREISETTDRFLLDKLEEMVSDVRRNDNDDEVKQKQTDIPTVSKDKSEEELEKYMKSESVFKSDSWCESSSVTCKIVIVIRTTCIPFPTFQWKMCSKRKSELKEISVPNVKEKNPEIKPLGESDNAKSSSSDKHTDDSNVSSEKSGEKIAKDSDSKSLENKEPEKQGDPTAKQQTPQNVEGVQKENIQTEKTNPSDTSENVKEGEESPTKQQVESSQDTTKQGESSTETEAPGDNIKSKGIESMDTKAVTSDGGDTQTQKTSTGEVGKTSETTPEGGKETKVLESETNAKVSSVDTGDKSAEEKKVEAPKTNDTATEKAAKEPNLNKDNDNKIQNPTDSKTESKSEKETAAQSPERKVTESTPTDKEDKSKESNDKSSKEKDEKHNSSGEASTKIDSKAEVKENGSKKELKEEKENVKKDQSSKEGAKPKKSEKVKSPEKAPSEPVKKPIKFEAKGQKEPKDCYDYYKSGKKKNGVFKIKPYGKSSMVEVFCDMKNGGWTVIQKRQDGTTKFLKKWQDFKEGFGGIRGEHWLGNDHIHYLTNQDHYTLMIELTDWNKTKKIAEYDYFMIDDEAEGYRLHIGGYHGDAGDGMAKHNNHKFSTPDVDNDKVTKEFGGSCAKRFSGAWWYYKCYMSNLNGIYYRNGKVPPKLFDGVAWKPWTGSSYSLRSAEMKIRPSTLT